MSYRRSHVKHKIHKIKPKKPFFVKPLFWVVVFVSFLVITGIYTVFFLDKIQVENVLVSGNKKIGSDKIMNITSDVVNKKIFKIIDWQVNTKSILFVNTNQINQKILSAFPEIYTAKVTKKFPQTVTIEIEERKQFGLFCQDKDGADECFSMDQDGVVFESLPFLPSSTIVLRQIQEYKDISIGERVIDSKTIQGVAKIGKELKNNFNIDIQEALISSPTLLVIKTMENWRAFFNFETDVDGQIAKMIAMLDSGVIGQDRSGLQYIDFRFKNRAYYK